MELNSLKFFILVCMLACIPLLARADSYEEKDDNLNWQYLDDDYEIGVTDKFFEVLKTEHRKYFDSDNNDWNW